MFEKTKKSAVDLDNKANNLYIEIGPNLRNVLEQMVAKIEHSNNSTYLNIAFAPICYLINNFVEKTKGEKHEA